jgi:glycosyltransferase involved in cell wall biosynthesis
MDLMRLAINAISAKMGGATTYLSNALLPILKKLDPVLQWPVFLWSGAPLVGLDLGAKHLNVRMNSAASNGGLARLIFDHIELPRALARDHVDILFSTANIGPLKLGCKHVLLVRNAAPVSDIYLHRMPNLKIKMRLRLTRWLMHQSILRANAVIFPSAAMRDAAIGITKRNTPHLFVAPYGTRHDLFFPCQEWLGRDDRKIQVLNVSYYSDQKNFGPFLGAAKILSRRTQGKFKFYCTAGFDVAWLAKAPQFPRFQAERKSFFELRRAGLAWDLGWMSYENLPNVYRSADVFVFPSYLESFGHPLVEAMACGLPVIASDTAVNREICGDAADYFEVFSSNSLAETLERLVSIPHWRRIYSEKSIERAKQFTWEAHAEKLADGLLRAWRGGRDT